MGSVVDTRETGDWLTHKPSFDQQQVSRTSLNRNNDHFANTQSVRTSLSLSLSLSLPPREYPDIDLLIEIYLDKSIDKWIYR